MTSFLPSNEKASDVNIMPSSGQVSLLLYNPCFEAAFQKNVMLVGNLRFYSIDDEDRSIVRYVISYLCHKSQLLRLISVFTCNCPNFNAGISKMILKTCNTCSDMSLSIPSVN